MQWTCQADGPLWWGILNSEKWYHFDTPPQELVADYLLAHPQDQGKTLLLIWWKTWNNVGSMVEIKPEAVQHEQCVDISVGNLISSITSGVAAL